METGVAVDAVAYKRAELEWSCWRRGEDAVEVGTACLGLAKSGSLDAGSWD